MTSLGTDVDLPGLGIALRIVSGLLSAAMVVCVKAVSDTVPLGEIVFFRSFFALIPLLLFLWLRNEFPHGLITRRPWGHVLRSLFGALALFTSFATVARLPLAEATLISHVSPVFIALCGAVFLSERLTGWRIGGVALGMAGVLVLVWPELAGGPADSQLLVGYALGILTAILSAFSLIMVRSLARTESPGAIALWFVVVSMFGGVATVPFGWVLPDGPTLMLLVLSGLFGGMAHIAMTLAFRYAEVSRLAPVEYVALIWPVLADLLIFRLLLAPAFLLALPMILLGAALPAMEGRRFGRNAA
ncbi:MAG: DMT family transporter [Alphaproteobacteria bacterium]|nr:DMT family transporter [Alphaproteobacteria bacterium]